MHHNPRFLFPDIHVYITLDSEFHVQTPTKQKIMNNVITYAEEEQQWCLTIYACLSCMLWEIENHQPHRPSWKNTSIEGNWGEICTVRKQKRLNNQRELIVYIGIWNTHTHTYNKNMAEVCHKEHTHTHSIYKEYQIKYLICFLMKTILLLLRNN